MSALEPLAADVRKLLGKRDRLADELAATDRAVMAAGRRYWQAQGCKMFPRVETLRRAVQS